TFERSGRIGRAPQREGRDDGDDGNGKRLISTSLIIFGEMRRARHRSAVGATPKRGLTMYVQSSPTIESDFQTEGAKTDQINGDLDPDVRRRFKPCKRLLRNRGYEGGRSQS